jgi:hypothetical protein
MKSHLKLFLLVMVLLSMPMSLWADYELLIYEKGKAEPVFSCWVTDEPKLTFNHEEGSLTATVSTLDEPVTILFNQVDHIDLKVGDKPITGIEEMTQGPGSKTYNLQFLDAQTVIVDGVSGNLPSALYSLDGKLSPAEVERSGSRVTFHLNQLPQGVYIIRIGQQSFKIIKKS